MAVKSGNSGAFAAVTELLLRDAATIRRVAWRTAGEANE